MTSQLLSEKMAQHMKQEIDKIKAERMKNGAENKPRIKRNRKNDKQSLAAHSKKIGGIKRDCVLVFDDLDWS